MVIEEADFRLIPIDDSTPRFDLELLYKVRPRNGESRTEFKNVAYGIQLDTAIKKIAQYRVSNKLEESAVSLKEYFKEFKQEVEELIKICRV